MGHVNVKLRLANPIDPNRSSIETTALVDTGAAFTTVPKELSDKLGLRPTGTRKVRTATQFESLEQSFASVEINGNLTVSPILVSTTLDKVLIGVITLEALGLTVDPTTGQLKEAETFLL
jgi:clan AA aspartic protease